jgi:hypothetical protein
VESRRAGRREPVVAPQPVVDDLLAVDTDQLVDAKPVEGRVQGAGTKPDPAVRDLLDVGDDPVPVLAACRQRRQDQEGRFLHRPFSHSNVIYR